MFGSNQLQAAAGIQVPGRLRSSPNQDEVWLILCEMTRQISSAGEGMADHKLIRLLCRLRGVLTR